MTTNPNRGKRTPDTDVDRKYDSDAIFAIVKHVRKHYDVRMDQIKQECTVELTGHGCKIHGEHMTLLEISALSKRHHIHTPDIVVTDKDGEPKLIIELDGKSHESMDVAARDKRRNKHYAKSGVPFIVINTAQLKRKNRPAFAHLDEEIEMIGWPRKTPVLQPG